MHSLRQAEFADTAEIAQRFALSEPHVRRLLRFVYLAPNTVEAVVERRRLLAAPALRAWTKRLSVVRVSLGIR